MKRFKLLATLILVSALWAWGQVDTGAIVGTVKDPSGAAIPGANIVVINENTNVSQSTKTGASGEYVVTSLKVGTYKVIAEQTGFQKYIQSGIVLNVQDRKQVDITLQLGPVSQEVQVTGDVPLLQTQSAALGQVVESKRIVDLPLNGRQYDQLALLTPGVTVDTPRQRERGQGVFSVNGNFGTQNNFVLDGVDNNSFSTNLQEGSAQVVIPAVDSLAEFKVQTRTYDAEFGRNAGSVVNASIKSGTNRIHGNVYEFLRNRNLDANNFFNNRAGTAKPKYQQNQFGFTLGGPVLIPKVYDGRNKTFWFGNYEGTRIRQGTTLVTTVPTPLMRQGDFREIKGGVHSPTGTGLGPYSGCINNNQLSASCMDPVAAKMFALFPLPNTNRAQEGVSSGFVGNNFIASPTYTTDNDQGAIRVDHSFSAKDTVFARYTTYEHDIFHPGVFFDVNPIADGGLNGVAGRTLNRGTGAAFNWTHVLGASLVNEFRVGFNRMASHSIQPELGQNVNDQFGIKGVPVSSTYTGGLPTILVTGFSGLGAPQFLPQYQISQIWQYRDGLTWNRGNHSFKFGGEWRRDSVSFLDLCCNRGSYSFNGQYTGSGITDLLLGLSNQGALTSLTIPHLYQNGLAWFVQDTWRMTAKLSVNYGLRYEYVSPLFERDNRITNFDPAARSGQGGLFTVDPKASGTFERTTVHPDKNNFAPRIGIAYQITPKLVLRTGAGYFFQGYDRHGSESQPALQPPFLTDVQQNFTAAAAPAFRLQDGFPANTLNPVDIANLDQVSKLFLRTMAGNLRTAYVGQASFGLQYSVTPDLAFEIGWVGNSAHKLWRFSNLNQGILNPQGQAPTIPFPDLRQNRAVPQTQSLPTTIEWIESIGNSYYNALQTKLERRFSKGLSFLASYTWSKGMGDALEGLSTSGDERGYGRSTSPQDYHNRKLDKGLFEHDITHRFVSSFSYELPMGQGHHFASSGLLGKILERWQVNGIVTYASGPPTGITSSIDSSRTGGNHSERGDCLRPPGSFTKTVDKWLDTDAYAIPRTFYFGTCGPTPGPRVPGLRNWDASLFKHIPITESKYFQFRAEFFNLFNTPQFQGPNPVVGNPNFGRITRLQVDPREVQFALKFYF